MRKIIFIFIIPLFFWTCNSEQKENEKRNAKCFEAIKMAQNSEESVKSTFLGFEFGMTARQLQAYCAELVKAGKLKIDLSDSYYYTFNTTIGDSKVYICPEYHNDSLYRISFKFEDAMYIFKAQQMFRDKNEDYSMQLLKLADNLPMIVYMIKGNQIVKFDTGAGLMIYENAPVVKRIDIIKEEKSKETLSDF